MGFESVLSNGRMYSGSRTKKNGMSYATYKNKNKGDYSSAVFVIGTDTLKKARIVIGDRLDILYDKESGRGLLRRVLEGGRKVSKASSGSTAVISTKMNSNFPIVPHITEIKSVSICDDGIVFDWPTGS